MPAIRDEEEETGPQSKPVPHDPPDQQADADSEAPDPWEGSTPQEDNAPPHKDVPDTDEAGTSRRSEPSSPVTDPQPEEPSG
ncbi:hypothetical protein [Streptomyces physcomitrii]|uniref:Uncharacterized protein n=1 Tax=Streptomyces physcomitrii TaxID=2724184 RepID=A0ABX1H0R8_9ACTN|nr:hypothetical protein [Streptomyces physcomitrii]NKI41957.1 hypothetical protein [Streptomyces physcomitrii]